MGDNRQMTFRRLLADVGDLLVLFRLENRASLDQWRDQRLMHLAEAVSILDDNLTEVSPREINLLEAILVGGFEVFDGIELPREVSTRLTSLRTFFQLERGRLFSMKRRNLERLEREFSDPLRPPTRVFRREGHRFYDLEIETSTSAYAVH